MAGSESGLGGVIAGLENCASQGKFSKNMIRSSTKKIWHIMVRNKRGKSSQLGKHQSRKNSMAGSKSELVVS